MASKEFWIDVLIIVGLNIAISVMVIPLINLSFSGTSGTFIVLTAILFFITGAVSAFILSLRDYRPNLILYGGVFGALAPISQNYIWGRALVELYGRVAEIGSEWGAGGFKRVGVFSGLVISHYDL